MEGGKESPQATNVEGIASLQLFRLHLTYHRSLAWPTPAYARANGAERANGQQCSD
jgi:hypothetical protein